MGEPIDLTHRFEPAEREAWRAQVQKELGGREPESARWRSLDGVALDLLYLEPEHPPDRGAPGAPPFVRGSEATRAWRIVHEPTGADRTSVITSATRALAEGADGLWLTPSTCARFERAEELAELFALGAPTWLEPGAHAIAFVSSALGAGERAAHVDVVCDPLGTLAAEGELPTSVARAFVQLADVLAHARSDSRPVLVSARPYHETGASAVDELALAIVSGVAYLRGLSDAGLHLAELPRRMRFELALDSDFFVGIAKLRAARLLWSKVLRTLGIDGPGQGLHVRATSSRRAASVLEPHLGVLRGTASAFAAVAGGAQLVSVAPYDALLGTPSAHAERLARNTQLILREESQLGRVLDPAGGSYFLEELTDSLARAAWTELGEIEHLGGVARGLADGSIAERVRAGAEARRRGVVTRERGLVGVNRYPAPDDPSPPAAPPLAPPLEGSGPKAVRDAARDGRVVDAILAAGSRSFAELTAALGAGDEPACAERLTPMREAEPFEALRLRALGLPDERRRALVLGVGEPRALKPRMDFARDVLEVAGLRVAMLDVAKSADAALAALDTIADVVVPCASDEEYLEVLRAIAPPLRQRGARQLVCATRPSDALREAGASSFVHRGADLAAVLSDVVAALEVA